MIESMIEVLMPEAVRWADAQQATILEQGRGLNEKEIADARSAGVGNPEKVRVLAVDNVPLPKDGALGGSLGMMGLQKAVAAGMALGYGIYLSRAAAENPTALRHELVHVAQAERMGGIAPFLRQYVSELATCGYGQSPLEREAEETAARIMEAL